jgi:hypothetical protein
VVEQRKINKIIYIVGIILSLGDCDSKTTGHSHIEKVYIINGKESTVLYDTDSKKSQMLIQDSGSVFFVMGTSKNNEWVELSKMPADPDEASGANEEKLLVYVPQKRVICHPDYGNKASLIGLDTINQVECVTWYLDDDRMDTTTITMLKKTCLENKSSCNCDSQ